MPAATAIMTGAGMAISAAGAAGSFIQAGKQNKLIREAKADAEKAMADARKSLEVNYYDVLGVNKDPYELQREAMLSQGAQAIQAAQESDRGATGAAGKVQMAMNEAQAGIRTNMGKEMSDIQKLQATEESRLRDVGTQLDLAEAEGAQQAAADAQKEKAAAINQGIKGITSLGQQAIQAAPLYGKKPMTPTVPTSSGFDAQATSFAGNNANGDAVSVFSNPLNPFVTPATYGQGAYGYAPMGNVAGGLNQ
jgi:vacuolar-type H+-ATPase subunit H